MKPGDYRHHPLVYILLSLLLLQTTSFSRLQPRKALPHPLPSLVDNQRLSAPDASGVETLVSSVGLLARRSDGWMLLTHDGPDMMDKAAFQLWTEHPFGTISKTALAVAGFRVSLPAPQHKF